MNSKMVSVALGIVVLNIGTVAQPGKSLPKWTWTQYHNARFAYSIDYPKQFKASKEPLRGDGKWFSFPNKNMMITVWGTYKVSKGSIKDQAMPYIDGPNSEGERWDFTKQKQGKNEFYAEGKAIRRGLIFRLIQRGETMAGITIEFELSDRKAFDPVFKRMVSSLKLLPPPKPISKPKPSGQANP